VSTDLKLEAVVIPVTDVDKAKAFYEQLEWRLDADFAFDNGFRVVQFTPPGSPASVQFGSNITSAAPGSARGLYLVVSDIEAARNELAAHGIDVSAAFHPKTPGAQFQPDTSDRIAGGGASTGARRHLRRGPLSRCKGSSSTTSTLRSTNYLDTDSKLVFLRRSSPSASSESPLAPPSD